jgi:polysaccharide export outer membrane protein
VRRTIESQAISAPQSVVSANGVWGVRVLVQSIGQAFTRLALLGALTVLGGCAFLNEPAGLPANGPMGYDVKNGRSDTSLKYNVVKLTPDAISVLHAFEPKGYAQLGLYALPGAFTDRRAPAQIKFGVGDVVSVTIFEAAAGGLFIPSEAGVRPGNFVQLPDQPVDNDGNISVPYAGTVRAAGRTNVEIQNDIVARIRNRAIEPQVVVSLSQQRTSLVTVVGEVRTPVRYPAAAAGAVDRILDAITRAGGISGQGYETFVMLERGGKRAVVPFSRLVYEPENNIYVQPGDQIYVYREQQKVIAFGATGTQGLITFDNWRLSLAEAVAKAGGVLDVQADPGSVFVYRPEPREVAEKLGVDLTPYENWPLIPIIFSVSFRDPGGYFLATSMNMRHDDVLFVANAQSVEVTKFLQYLNVIMSTTTNGVNMVDDAFLMRQTIHNGWK